MKIYLVSANHGGTFVVSKCVLVCPKKTLDKSLKRVLESVTFAYDDKTRVCHFPETWLLWLLTNYYDSVLNKIKSITPPLFNGKPWDAAFCIWKSKSFAENLFNNSNLDDSSTSLSVFSFTTNLKFFNIPVNSSYLGRS